VGKTFHCQQIYQGSPKTRKAHWGTHNVTRISQQVATLLAKDHIGKAYAAHQRAKTAAGNYTTMQGKQAEQEIVG
jgi:hypothetical protein